jgi:predicted ATPase
MSATAVELPRTGTVANPQHALDAHQAAVTASASTESALDRRAVILTPDQRVRVFISSTLGELAEERAAARRAVRRLHLAPVWYESGARPHPPRSMYRAYLQQSQVFVGIYWQRYGWVAPGMDISGLEDEYRLAAGKPMLIYLKRPAPDQEPRMKTFLDSIRAAGTVSYRTFTTPRELERLLADDLALLLSERFHGAATSTEAPHVSLRQPAAPVGNLSAQVSSFIGRGRELELTAAALGEARLVTLTGPGGVGKTRLALQVAGQLAPRFGDGTWVCELAPVRDAAGMDDAVATVFSVTARSGQSTREALVDFLRNQELMLVLDNCEHLLAGVAALAAALQRSCPRLAILATSREGLGIDGERLVPVPSLAVPAADDGVEVIMQAEAVRLFADRATAVKPDFTVTPENAAAVVAICRRLDGVPLAIELAAARVPAMTPAELARRLDRSFAVLAGARRGAADRHQTLRAAIDWSFDLLAEPEQALLGRLAVFAGGCTLEAAEKVCGGDGIDPEMVSGLMASLVARSLVVADQHGSESRYRLLETIRQYGEELMQGSGQTERWQARHAEYYTDLLSGVRDHARDCRDEVFWAVRLSAEQDNLLAAWSWAIETGNVDTAFAILAGFAPCEIWNSYPLLFAGRSALELPGASGHPGYPLALAVSAVFASIRADGTGAEELCRRAADANARLATPDWRVEETICAARQNIANTRGAFADAALLAEQAAGIARTGGDLADASVELTIAVADHVLVGQAPRAVPLAI